MQTLLMSFLFAADTQIPHVLGQNDQVSIPAGLPSPVLTANNQFTVQDNDHINHYQPCANDAHMNDDDMQQDQNSAHTKGAITLPSVGTEHKIITSYPFLIVSKCQDPEVMARYMYLWNDKKTKYNKIEHQGNCIVKYCHENNILKILHITNDQLYFTAILDINAPISFEQQMIHDKTIPQWLSCFADCHTKLEGLTKIDPKEQEKIAAQQTEFYAIFQSLPSGASYVFDTQTMLFQAEITPSIFRAIYLNKGLTHLDLSHSIFTEDTARALGATLKVLDKPLEKLDLSSTNLTPAWFRKAMPRPYKNNESYWGGAGYFYDKLNEACYNVKKSVTGQKVVPDFYDFTKFPKTINLCDTALTPEVQKEWIQILRAQNRLDIQLIWEKTEDDNVIKHYDRIERAEAEVEENVEQPEPTGAGSAVITPQKPHVSNENDDTQESSPISAFDISSNHNDATADSSNKQEDGDLDDIIRAMEASVND